MKRLLSIVIAGILAGFTACTDILDSAPYNKPASSTMWTTENLTEMGIAGVYQVLRIQNFEGHYDIYGYYAYDCLGTIGMQHEVEPILRSATNTSNSMFSEHWRRLYEGVHRANDAIANIPVKSPVSDERKRCLVAEAKFLRAWCYYRLNELFRGVPIYLEPIIVEECIKTQNTEDEVWEQIIKDLTDCVNEPNLPDRDAVTARVSKGAAYALMGKVYMQQHQWENAAAAFSKVGECGYKLFQGGYKELFTEANERCEEMIFSIQNTTDVGYGGNTQWYLGTNSAYGSGWNTFLPSPRGVDLYENADGTPFNWDDVIPGYNDMNPAYREVFFIRDTKKNNEEISEAVTSAVETRLNGLPEEIRALYLPEGNEARIRKAYLNRDPRLEMTVITPYSDFLGWISGTTVDIMLTHRWPYVDRNGDLWSERRTMYYLMYRKFVYEGVNTIIARDRIGTDDPLIRYADVVLQWAEALVELNRLDEAAEKVNMVRGRTSVNMPPVKYADQAELRAKVRKERRVELFGEGYSFFDDMRWRSWKEDKFTEGNGNLHAWGQVATTAYTWLGDHLYIFPVPASEVEKNPNLKKTPGWTY